MRRRRILCTVAIFSLMAAAAKAWQGHIEGGVTAIITAGGTGGSYPSVYSVGDASYIGTYDSVLGYNLFGLHQIFGVAARSFSRHNGSYFGTLLSAAQYQQCYSASLSADVNYSEINGGTWFRSVCAPPPPTECVGGGPLPTGIVPLAVRGAGGCGNSPVIFDLDDNGFELSGPADPVTFDIDGDGLPDRITWSARRSHVAFLALDRNRNGRIDNGRELFGNHTLLTTGETAPNGYIALSEFDRLDMGGNADGVIGPEDAVWTSLRLWVDQNHNGISEPNELLKLDQAHIASVDYDYSLSWRTDQYGNVFRYKGQAWRQRRREEPKRIKTYDVFFQDVP